MKSEFYHQLSRPLRAVSLAFQVTSSQPANLHTSLVSWRVKRSRLRLLIDTEVAACCSAGGTPVATFPRRLSQRTPLVSVVGPTSRPEASPLIQAAPVAVPPSQWRLRCAPAPLARPLLYRYSPACGRGSGDPLGRCVLFRRRLALFTDISIGDAP